MVSSSSRRRAIQESIEKGLGGVAQACRAVRLSRSAYYRTRGQGLARGRIRARVLRLSQAHPRYGYRRITVLLRRAGERVNAKRVQRIRRLEGLQVRQRQRRTRRAALSTSLRQRAQHANHVWSWDFVQDQTENGTPFRILTLIDEYTREWLAVHVAWSIRAVDVITVVEAAFARYGTPAYMRSDNGPEFIAYAITDWLAARAIQTNYITPGCPWEQAHIESFHDKLRDEFLNRELFGSLLEAKVLVEGHRQEYNDERPHSSLGDQTPAEYAGRGATKLRSGSALAPFSRAIHPPIKPKPNTAKLLF